jgi:allantoate deiminase
MERLDVLGTFSAEADRLTRPYASEAMRETNSSVADWMREAGMVVRQDNTGNLRGRYMGVDGATLLIGSHLDSVRDAGRYDGPLGVMVAIAAVQRLHDRGRRLPFAIEVLGFADEEGLRFGCTYLGSRALAGRFEPADLDRVDAVGTSMREAMRDFGGDPERVQEDAWRDGQLLGYCEVHIEQGPALEARDLPVGVVSAIAGQARHRITFTGQAAHAGTTPMDRRRDALAAAAELVLAVEREGRSHPDLVATVGQLEVSPGAVNVVPGEAALSLDVRHADDEVRVEATRTLLEAARAIASRRSLDVAAELLLESRSVRCAPRLTALLARSVEDLGHPVLELASGAGHDAVAMSDLTDVAMLFVRCKGGVSHNPAESVTTADVAVAIDVLSRFVQLLAQT